MKLYESFLLTVMGMGALAADGSDARNLFRGPNPEVFQTTKWINPIAFSPNSETLASPMNDNSGSPGFLQFYAPNGGSLSTILQTPTGLNIKMILLCSNQNRPMIGVEVKLHPDSSADSGVTLPFVRMSKTAPGCAIYGIPDGVDDWDLPGKILDSRVYKKIEIVLPASRTPGHIEAVGVRLQAAHCHEGPDSAQSQKNQTCHPKHGTLPINCKTDHGSSAWKNCRAVSPPMATDTDDVSDVYFNHFTAGASR